MAAVRVLSFMGLPSNEQNQVIVLIVRQLIMTATLPIFKQALAFRSGGSTLAVTEIKT